jgi:hypothetical protein
VLDPLRKGGGVLGAEPGSGGEAEPVHRRRLHHCPQQVEVAHGLLGGDVVDQIAAGHIAGPSGELGRVEQQLEVGGAALAWVEQS